MVFHLNRKVLALFVLTVIQWPRVRMTRQSSFGTLEVAALLRPCKIMMLRSIPSGLVVIGLYLAEAIM